MDTIGDIIWDVNAKPVKHKQKRVRNVSDDLPCLFQGKRSRASRCTCPKWSVEASAAIENVHDQRIKSDNICIAIARMIREVQETSTGLRDFRFPAVRTTSQLLSIAIEI
jgi:hypothetical protein